MEDFMDRLKTFLTYILIIVVFFVVSIILENGLIKNMYYDMDGTAYNNLNKNGQILDIDVIVKEAKSTNTNGYITVTVKNNSDKYINEAYVNLKLYSKSDILAVTKYMQIKGLSGGERKTYTLKFKGSYINKYEVLLKEDFPNKDYIINFFGYELDTRNILGMDLSEYINTETFSSFGQSVFHTISVGIKNIPVWAWFWAWMIVVGVW